MAPRSHIQPDRTPLHEPGFTLVEVLIVVVILGILAAIVVPRYNRASDEAYTSNTLSQLQSIRSQLLLYTAEHLEQPPTLAQMQGFAALVGRTDIDGAPNANGAYGPYLRKPPVNAFTNSASVVAPGAGSATDGWEYDDVSGSITAVGFDESTGVFTAPE